ncbi:MAG: LysM peptidoglycan-binding domain-containing protein [Verrucomicrobiota bacterium]|jgi:LysM repeat protein
MTFPVGLFRIAPLLLAGLVLSGCLPPAPGDEEKEPYYMAGKSHVNTMDFKGAVESFEKAIEVNPKSAPAHFELGWLYDQKESDSASAIYHYERYLKLLPNSGRDELIKTRILACKQQLAQTVSLGAWTEKQQHDLEQLVEENKHLHEEVEKLRANPVRQQNSTNQTAAGSATTPVVPPSVSRQPVVTGVPLSNPPNPGRPAVTPAAIPRTHIVKAGENLNAIARKYGVKLDALLAANPRLNPRRLSVGQVLTIPRS